MSEQVPLRADDILVLRGRAFDPNELHEAIAPLGLTAGLTTRWRLVETEVKQLLVEHGVSYVWQLVRLQEAIMPPSADVPALLAMLTQMLTLLSPRESFVVVDRYLLPKKRSADYRDRLVSILEPLATRVASLTLVTDRSHDAALLQDISTEISRRAPECRVVHRTSTQFHDRFWLADLDRGLLVGTSLNGLGNRYALVDRMRSSDVQEIVQALRSEDLV